MTKLVIKDIENCLLFTEITDEEAAAINGGSILDGLNGPYNPCNGILSGILPECRTGVPSTSILSGLQGFL